jgi:hypothetical protein
MDAPFGKLTGWTLLATIVVGCTTAPPDQDPDAGVTPSVDAGEQLESDGGTTEPDGGATEPDPLPEGALFIIGPQVPMGESLWPFHDANFLARAQGHHDAALVTMGDDALNAVYYDLSLALYILAHRSGSSEHLTWAEGVAAWWWEGMPARVAWETWRDPFAISPRNSSLGGLMLHALRGGGAVPLSFELGNEGGRVDYDLWGWLTAYVRHAYQIWLGLRLQNSSLHYGVRDGGYMLLYTAWLAHVHPDPAVRDELTAMALAAARDYYARLQADDGGWYWVDGSEPWEQPFMVGLLLEGMIATHQLTGDDAVRQAILRSVDHLWTGYRTDTVPELPEVQWRSVPYFVFPDGRWQGETNLEGGWDTNTIREGRQRNSLILHAFGYAYRLTKDEKYRQWGDALFSATFGKGEGPGADAYYGLADYRSKEFNQAYRSGGRYLRWRQD